MPAFAMMAAIRRVTIGLAQRPIQLAHIVA
jgi:hypothetical protein